MTLPDKQRGYIRTPPDRNAPFHPSPATQQKKKEKPPVLLKSFAHPTSTLT